MPGLDVRQTVKRFPKRLRQSLDIGGIRRSVDISRVAPAGSDASSDEKHAAGDSSSSGSQADDTIADLPQKRQPEKSAVAEQQAVLSAALLEKERLQTLVKELEASAAGLRTQNQRLQAAADANEQEARKARNVSAFKDKEAAKLKEAVQQAKLSRRKLQAQLAETQAKLETVQAQLADSQAKAEAAQAAALEQKEKAAKSLDFGLTLLASGCATVALGAALGVLLQRGGRLSSIYSSS